eukprot:9302989-Pyramimonas_sp.AAC.2
MASAAAEPTCGKCRGSPGSSTACDSPRFCLMRRWATRPGPSNDSAQNARQSLARCAASALRRCPTSSSSSPSN